MGRGRSVFSLGHSNRGTISISPDRPNNKTPMSKIDAETRPVTLLGWPIEHTLSPVIHNTAFAAQELNFVYLASAVRPERIGEAVSGLRALNFAGANVTIPHKEKVGPHLDEIAEEARAVGAVNTIVVEEREEGTVLRGENTDVEGFLRPLEAQTEDLRGESALIFGSGGAARAVTYALLTDLAPSTLTLAARSPEKAEQIAEDLAPWDEHGGLSVTPLSEAGSSVRSSRLLVNATPVGMYPHTEATIWEPVADFQEDHIAYDLVYRPRRTRWLREVGEQGGTTIGGLDMLIAQAATSFYHWTGTEMPERPVRRALKEAISTEA